MKHPISIKWIYAPRDPEEGTRVLVDRLWPHGRDRDELAVDHWWHDAAPSSALKRQYTQDEINWKEFARLYRNELHTRPQPLRDLKRLAQKGPVTLLTLEREAEHSPASLLLATFKCWKDPADEDPLEAAVVEGG